jgi:hypothetical protein
MSFGVIVAASRLAGLALAAQDADGEAVRVFLHPSAQARAPGTPAWSGP